MTKTIVVGDTTPDLADFAKLYNTTHVDKTNIKTALTCNNNYHVSLGDVELIEFINLLDTADQIVLQSKNKWSNETLLLSTLYVCRSYSHCITVKNIDAYPGPFSYVKNYSTTTACNLWLFGGSLVAGKGLHSPDKESFGYHLGNMLGVDQVINTAQRGCGLRRSLEILVNSDIHPGDYVVLDPTTLGRLRLYQDGNVVDLHLSKCEKTLVLALTEDQLYYDFISGLDTFVKICNLAQVKLVFFSWQPYTTKILDCYNYFSQHPSWSLPATYLLTDPLDIGSEPSYPGPETHIKLAKILYQHLS
jgi:hypothetical protein